MTKDEASKQVLVNAYKLIQHFRSKKRKHPQDGLSTLSSIETVLKEHYQTEV